MDAIKVEQKSAEAFVLEKSRHERGIGLIVVILILAFMLGVGIVLVSITSSGSRVTGNIRWQEQAFNAAEAGFDAAWLAIDDFFKGASWLNFDGHCLQSPTGIDLPLDVNYFRKKTDLEILAMLDQDGDGNPDDLNVIFFKMPFAMDGSGGVDPRYTYTAFLIDDEAGGGTPNPLDALLICIGVVQLGDSVATARLEVGLATEMGT
ncbi:MAG: pilus assembly PilX N-terminal domain-containing protein [Candidatus Aminicenantes bacterium]|nr:pilus assembly PilX N-terminal domain-containing protein [Candidatus Aminicenantes bacterium]